MKDGDVSVVIQKVTTDDTGHYECRVLKCRQSASLHSPNLPDDPIRVVYLRTVPPDMCYPQLLLCSLPRFSTRSRLPDQRRRLDQGDFSRLFQTFKVDICSCGFYSWKNISISGLCLNKEEMTAAPASLCCTVLLFSCVFADQKTIIAAPGQTVTLPCRAPNNNLIVVDWSRADLDPEYLLLYRDGHFDSDNQHSSFKNRVELQDRQMNDGDVSVILKNVMIADTGTYECRIKEKGKSRAVLENEPISNINLRVVASPGSGGSAELARLSVSALLLVAALVVAF